MLEFTESEYLKFPIKNSNGGYWKPLFINNKYLLPIKAANDCNLNNIKYNVIEA